MKILCFGSLNIDHVYSVQNIVRPGETASALGLRLFPGGKGLNQAIALAKAGGDVFMAGMTGADGGLLLDALSAAGVNSGFVETAEGPSGHAVIQVDAAGQNSIIIYGGANQRMTPEYADKVIGNFQKGDILVLQNEINGIPYIMEKAAVAGLFTVMNPSPVTPGLLGYPLHLADLFFINETEGAELTGETEPHRILSAMCGKYPRARVVLTLGCDGAYYRYGEKLIYQPVYEACAVDTTGAGDTFTGYFTAAIARGETPEDALKKAACAAAIAVTRPGAASSIPELREVEGRL